ncbi:MAG TPA: hypothetical protein VJ872_13995 [Nocardioides sp.]|nr:hypothetical protein [Nocardioides sp.]
MTRTRLLNVAGIAVALVLLASWALGVLWSEHRAPAAAARTAATTSARATATGTPDAARVHPLRPKSRHTTSASADPTTASASATAAATHHAAAHHTAGSHHSSGGGGQTSTPSAHPTSAGGSSTPTPSPTPSQDVLTQILGGLTHLPH